jgi:hypothetical protein
MFLGLVISGVTAYVVSGDPDLYKPIIFNGYMFKGLLIGELLLVFGLVWMAERISAGTAILLFLLYCFSIGLTLSVIFLVYTIESIGQMFFVSALMFGVMSIYGFYTKTDLTHIGQVLIMGLFGLIIAGITNMILNNATLDWILSIVGVVTFTGLTAYDTQKIRQLNKIGNAGTEEDTKEAILGALNLYLDYVNLFLKLLRLFGKRKS